ncbi:MAG: hypothetical protein K2H19_03325 [Ruminococcus sp.]|nr:hypothetical protein [Ruminococcus sp.]
MLTENAENFVESKLLEYRSEVEAVLSGGSISQYNYCECIDDNNETYDKNYENRLRISLALWYMSDGLDVEFLTVALMNEEIKYLERTPYGGTSKTIFLLSQKMLEYKKCSYRNLFRRARYANFDCFFECDIYYIKKFAKRFNDWHSADWDYIFYLLDDKKSQEILKYLENSKE